MLGQAPQKRAIRHWLNVPDHEPVLYAATPYRKRGIDGDRPLCELVRRNLQSRRKRLAIERHGNPLVPELSLFDKLRQ